MYDLTTFTAKFPAIPQELVGQLSEVFGDQYDASFTRLSIKGFQFALRGAQEQVFNEPVLNVVIVGEAKEQHHVYYSQTYDPSNEDVKPTACWLHSQPIPRLVPANKRVKDAEGRNGYYTRQRIVLCVVGSDGVLSAPVVFDVNAKSLFGNDLPNLGAMSYASFRRYCASNKILPCQVPVQIVFDRSDSVPLVKFKPARDANGRPICFDQAQQMAVFNLAVSPDVKELLKINIIDDSTVQAQAEATLAQAAPVAQPTPAPVVTPQPQPQPQPQPVVTPAPQPEPVPVAQPAPAPQPVATPVPQVAGNPADMESQADAMLETLLQTVRQ